MCARAEYLAASGVAQQELVLLHGWGGNRELWRPLLACLRPWANVTLLDIPGCAPGLKPRPEQDMQGVLRDLLAHCPERAVYIGHSLGGNLALELAQLAPERVAGLVTVASNPQFVAGDDWPGMDPAEFGAFSRAVSASPAAALRRFDSLQVSGAHNARALLRGLRALDRIGPGAELMPGLDWLQQLNQQHLLAGRGQPRRHLFGEQDSLVPVEAAERVKGAGGGTVQVLPGSHLLPLQSPAQLAASVGEFLALNGLLNTAAPVPAPLEKAEMASSFSRAAPTYDSVAVLQRDVGNRLLQCLEKVDTSPRVVLDLGCGTGHFAPELRRRFPRAQHIGLDIAPGMVEFARAHHGQTSDWAVGDAEELPLATASVDLIFSSLALQWCHRPGQLFAELSRVLRPGGKCVFTTLGPQTLTELRQAWAAVDSHTHVNDFQPPEELQEAAAGVAGLSLSLDARAVVMEYESVRELLTELKGIGAHNMNRQRRTGLTSRRALQGMLGAYEQWRREGLLPATYEVLFGVMEKA